MIPQIRKCPFGSTILAMASLAVFALATRSQAAEIRYVMQEYRHALDGDIDPDHYRPSSYGEVKILEDKLYVIERPDGTTIPIRSDIPGTKTNISGWNSSGQVIGNVYVPNGGGSTGYVFENGRMTLLRDLVPGKVLGIQAINESGLIVGGGALDAPYIYDNGSFEEIPVPEGFSGGVAIDVNESNVVVGVFMKYGRTLMDGMPFLYDDGQLLDLNEITMGIDGYQIISPQAILDDGRMVVGAVKFMDDGTTQGGVLYLRPFDPSTEPLPPPVPEPSTIAIWVLAAGSVLLGKRLKSTT